MWLTHRRTRLAHYSHIVTSNLFSLHLLVLHTNMVIKNEDTIPESYPYFWDKGTGEAPLKDFLAKVRRQDYRLHISTTVTVYSTVQAVYGSR